MMKKKDGFRVNKNSIENKNAVFLLDVLTGKVRVNVVPPVTVELGGRK